MSVDHVHFFENLEIDTLLLRDQLNATTPFGKQDPP
jgi:hypothetical protein